MERTSRGRPSRPASSTGRSTSAPARIRRRADRSQERFAQVLDEVGGQLLGSPTRVVERGDGTERTGCIVVTERVDHRSDLGSDLVDRPRRCDLVERGQRVARRASTPANRDRHGFGVEVESGTVPDLAEHSARAWPW